MSKTKLITFFLPSLEGGGAERVIVEIANAFHAKGHQVELVVGNAYGPYKEEIATGVSVIDFGKKRVLSCLLPFALYLKRQKPVAVYTTMMHTNVVALLAKRLSFSKARVIVREAVTTEKTNGKPISEGKSALLRLAAAVYPGADAIVCVSHGVLDSLKRDLSLSDGAPIEVILNPVISKEFFRKSQEAAPLLSFKRKNSVLLVAVARLVVSKDYPTLLQAFALVRESMDAQLLILGEGSERAHVEQLVESLGIKEDVLLPGFVSNPYAYIQAADLFVHSSLYEGMPNAVIQALALKKKAVVTRTKDGPSELFEGVQSVQLVETGDPVAFSKAILEMLALDSVGGPDSEWFDMFSSSGVVEQYEKHIS